MEGMFSISQKAVACVISVYCGAPRVGLRLGTLHKSCRGHCPWRTCSIPCLLLAGVTRSQGPSPSISPQAGAASAPMRDSSSPPRSPACLPFTVTKHWRAGEGLQQQQGMVKWPFLHWISPIPICLLSMAGDLVRLDSPESSRGNVPDHGNQRCVQGSFTRKVRSYRKTAPGLSCKFIILTPANIKKNTPLGKLFHPHCLTAAFPFTEKDTLAPKSSAAVFPLATAILESSLNVNIIENSFE